MLDNGSQWLSLTGEIANIEEFGASSSAAASVNNAAIQDALDNAPAIFIPPRTFDISAVLTVPSNRIIIGLGDQSILNWIGVPVLTVMRNVDWVGGNSNIRILAIRFTGPAFTGSDKGGWVDMRIVTNLIVRDVRASGNNGSGVFCRQCTKVLVEGCNIGAVGGQGVDVNSTVDGRIIGNVVDGNNSDAIAVYAPNGTQDSEGCVVLGNQVRNCAGHGIIIGLTTPSMNVLDCTVKGNSIKNATLVGIVVGGGVINSTVNDNKVREAQGNAGIKVTAGTHGTPPNGITIAKNGVWDSVGYGIHLDGASSNLRDIAVQGNRVRGSGEHGIYVEATDKTVSEISVDRNHVSNSAQVDPNSDGIAFAATGAAGVIEECKAQGNRCWDDQGVKTQRYGMLVYAGGGGVLQQSQFTENHLRGNLNTGLNRSGDTNCFIRNNKGYNTEAKGTGTIPNAATSVVINHGLSLTPAVQDIKITPSGTTTNPPGHMWVDTITATQFTVHCTADPGAGGLTFGWQAIVT